VIETLFILVGAAVAAAGAWKMWQQRQQTTPADAIRLVSSKYLGGKRFLTIVEVDGERLLLGVAGEQVSLVTRLGAAREREDAAQA
jgi:flagellar biogenesis protein FliO